jgi:hypothetical protein
MLPFLDTFLIAKLNPEELELESCRESFWPVKREAEDFCRILMVF